MGTNFQMGLLIDFKGFWELVHPFEFTDLHTHQSMLMGVQVFLLRFTPPLGSAELINPPPLVILYNLFSY